MAHQPANDLPSLRSPGFESDWKALTVRETPVVELATVVDARECVVSARLRSRTRAERASVGILRLSGE
jgi:hypothetical protein